MVDVPRRSQTPCHPYLRSVPNAASWQNGVNYEETIVSRFLIFNYELSRLGSPAHVVVLLFDLNNLTCKF